MPSPYVSPKDFTLSWLILFSMLLRSLIHTLPAKTTYECGDAEFDQLWEHFRPLLLWNGCNMVEVEMEWFSVRKY